LKFYIKIVI